LTVVYQLEGAVRRLLWGGERRGAGTLRQCFRYFGPERTRQLRFIGRDLWQPYLVGMRPTRFRRGTGTRNTQPPPHGESLLYHADAVIATRCRALLLRGEGHIRLRRSIPAPYALPFPATALCNFLPR
jgi:hypothetical protein